MRKSEKKLCRLVNAKTTRAMMMAVVSGLGAASAPAQLYWDPNHATTPAGGAGTWHTAGAWSSSATSYVAANWSDGATAEFPGATATVGTITLDSAASVGTLEFLNPTGSNIIVGSSTLTITGGINNKGPSGNQFINVPLGGTDLNINKDNTNANDTVIALQAANVFTGNVHLTDNNGTPNTGHFMRLNINVAGAIPSTAKIFFDTTQCELTASTFAGQVTSTTENVNDIALQGESFIGAGSLSATVFQTLAINGTMSGVSNLTIQTGTGGGGGVVQLNHAATYGDPSTGSVTTFNTTTSATGHGWVVWGVDNALPTSTQIQLGLNTSTFGTGVLDLAGHSQTVAALGTGIQSVGASSQGITTSVGGAAHLITITGSSVSSFRSTIGVPTTNLIPTGASTNGNDIALTLSNTHTGVLNLTGTNTYTGGTIVNGGTLLANSTNSTGSGAVTIASGAQLGGSGTIAGAVTSTGTLLPGESVTAGTTAFNGTITTGGIGTLSIGGGLTLNSTSVANYDFTTTSEDKIAVTGALNLPSSGTETVNVTYAAGSSVANGTFPLFSYTTGSLSAGQFGTLKFGNGLQTETIGAATLTLLNDAGAVDLKVTGGKDSVLWKGPTGVGSGTWNTSTTNWTNNGVASTYSDNTLVTFDDSAQGTGTLTITINNGGTAVQPFQTIFNNSTKNYSIASNAAGDVIGGSGGVTKNGTGAVTFSGVQTYTGDTAINAGTLLIGASGGLGSDSSHNVTIASAATLTVAAGGTAGAGSIKLNSGGTLNVADAAAVNNAANVNFAGGTFNLTGATSAAMSVAVSQSATTTLNTNANNLTYGGTLTNTASGQIVKIGTGTLTLSSGSTNSTYTGGWMISAGTVAVASGAVTGGDPSNSIGGTVPGIGIGSSNFNTDSLFITGGTLALQNVAWGNYQGTTASPEVFMGSTAATTLLVSGNSSFGRGSFSWQINRGTAAAPITVDFSIPTAGDSMTFQNSLGMNNSAVTVAGANIIRVNNGGGQGRLVLNSGGVTSAGTFAGNWIVNGGILQLGPVIENKMGPAYLGPFGEPFNALGFAASGFPSTAQGDPDAPNPVTLNSGAILALGVDHANQDDPAGNPNATGTHWNSTPQYLRAPITLNGGALAATASEVDYSIPTDLGRPTGVAVVARFGGDVTMTGAITSKILLYNPNPLFLTEARTVEFVGGQRTLANASPAYPTAGSVITYALNWAGTLEITNGAATGGSFNIIRGDGNYGDAGVGGTVSVATNSLLQIDAGANVNLGGSLDALNGGSSHYVNVTTGTAALFHVMLNVGTKNAGTIEGTGNTTVESGSTLIATHIRQNTLTVNGTARVRADGTSTATSVVSTLNATIGKLDLSNNKLVVKGGNVGTFVGSAYTGISGLAEAGRNTGAWDGATGLVTSQAAAGAGVTNLAVESAADAKGISGATTASFGGQTVTAADVLVMYTYAGDANMDGKVNADDYFVIDSNYNKNGTSFGYAKGDFNYDGKINGDDYAVIDAGFSGQGAQFPAAPGLAGVSAVPEPTAISLIGLAVSTLGMRRRRR